MRIRFGIADPDRIYLERLSRLFSRRYKNQIEIYSFSEKDQISGAVRDNRINILAVSPSVGLSPEMLPESCMTVYLVDENGIGSYNDSRVLCKYQRADSIYRDILDLYSERLSDRISYRNRGGERASVTLFVSDIGLPGAETMAASCAAYQSSIGKKPLFLNLSQFGCSRRMFSAPGSGTFSDAIFAAKSRKTNMVMRLESLSRQSRDGVYFYESCIDPLDYMDMTDTDLSEIMEALVSGSGYDSISVVCDLYLSERLQLLVGYADDIILVSDSRQGTETRKKALRDLGSRNGNDISDRIKIVVSSSVPQDSMPSDVPVITVKDLSGKSDDPGLVGKIAGSGVFERLMA